MPLTVRKNILDTPVYEPGKPIEEVQREYGLSEVIKMASNENPLGPSKLAVEAIRANAHRVHEFPGDGSILKKSIAEKLGINKEQILLGNGGDEIIRLIIMGCSEEGDEVIVGQPAFASYFLAAHPRERKIIAVPLKDFVHDLEAMALAISDKTKILFVANPNNPTGTIVTKRDVDVFMGRVPEDAVVVFDEAYHEYVKSDDYPETINFVKQDRNVIILRTFSKAYGLAGLRIGYAIAKEELVSAMDNVRLPFNTNILGQVAATAALQDVEHVEKSVQVNEEGKKYLYGKFEELGLPYVPTYTNFILVDLKADCREIHEKLLQKGVIVRPMDGYGLPTSARITIGTPTENQKLITALADVIS